MTMPKPVAVEVTVATKSATGKVAPIEANVRPAAIRTTAKPAPVEPATIESTTAKAGSTETGATTGKSAAAVSLCHCA